MKPVLTFTPQMFAAAKALRKDITRRVATTGNENHLDRLAYAIHQDLDRDDGLMTEELALWNTFPPPYGPPGTILPMATTWAAAELYDSKKPREMEGVQSLWFDDGTPKPGWAGKNRPSRFLPKSLYYLAPQVQIVSSRAECLFQITQDDARREGIYRFIVRECEYFHSRPEAATELHFNTPVSAFIDLWDSINAKRAEGQYAAAHNPIVWRIEFKLL